MQLNINLAGAAPNVTSLDDLGRIIGSIVFIYGTSTPAAAKRQLEILTRELRDLGSQPDFVRLLDALGNGIKELEVAQEQADKM